MEIKLCERREEHVITFYYKTGDPQIQKMFPKRVNSLDEALLHFRESLKEEASSYGRTIYVEGEYIGDIWCYRIYKEQEPNAMLSYCIFEKKYWGKGIATQAVRMFLEEIRKKYLLKNIGAFTYSFNTASIRVLEKNELRLSETFRENGMESNYFIYSR